MFQIFWLYCLRPGKRSKWLFISKQMHCYIVHRPHFKFDYLIWLQAWYLRPLISKICPPTERKLGHKIIGDQDEEKHQPLRPHLNIDSHEVSPIKIAPWAGERSPDMLSCRWRDGVITERRCSWLQTVRIVALIGRAFVWESCLLGFLKVRTAGICSLCKCLPKYAVAAETWELCRLFHDADIPTLVLHISLSQFKTLEISTQWDVVLWSNDRWGWCIGTTTKPVNVLH